MTTNKLASLLGSSKRVIINDIAYFRENYNAFSIESSYEGIRLIFKQEANLKDFYQKVLGDSIAFNALESIFFKENINSATLSEMLFISESSLYRITREIDTALKEYFNISLLTNEYEFYGDEQAIRYFFYLYFLEKYPNTEWPFKNINESAFDELLNFFIELSGEHMNYAYYRNFKLVTAVNLTRVLNNKLINFDLDKTNLSELVSNSESFLSKLRPIAKKLNFTLSFETILQIFNNYVRVDFALNYERLIINAQKDPQLLESVEFLSTFLNEICQKFDVYIPNKKELIWHISNAAHNEGFEPHSGYILHNRNRLTLLEFKNKSPDFFDFISIGLTNYRSMINKPPTQFSLNHLIFQIFVCWENLLPQLQNKWRKVKLLLISDINNGHGNLIKEQIEYYFNHKIIIEIFDSKLLTSDNIKSTQCDIVISTFPIPTLKDIPVICLNNILTTNAIELIDSILDEIISQIT